MVKPVPFRCFGSHNPVYAKYHDEEWGVPEFDDRKLFEMLILEGAHAGLSWELILMKREHYREAFDGFVPERVAVYGVEKIEELMANRGIVRNRLKINAAVKNAKVFLEIQKEFHSFSSYLWSFVNHRPIRNHWETREEVPSRTEISDKLSQDLKRRGMSFVGSTIMYSFMQAVGMVNDHILDCPRHASISSLV